MWLKIHIQIFLYTCMFPKTFTKPHNLLLWTSIFKQPAWKEFMSLLAVRIWRFFIMLSSPGPKSLSYTFLWKMGKPITWLSVLHLYMHQFSGTYGAEMNIAISGLFYTIPIPQVVPCICQWFVLTENCFPT